MTGIDELVSAGQPFAILYRPETSREHVELLRGAFTEVNGTAELPDDDVLVLLPYRLIGERGYDHHDDGEPMLAMTITERSLASVRDVPADWPIEVGAGEFDLAEPDYAALVDRVIAEEIGHGAGANFVLKRTFHAQIDDWSPRTALAFFGRLLRGEPGAYWTFLIHTGERTFVGASPERHVSLADGTAVMTPISGTYRYPPDGPSVSGVLDFLADSKETNELYMVLDEELKMMSRICDDPRVVGPVLNEMAHLAHTEYRIEGRSTLDYRSVLRETLFAPTVTGSPLESACRVIKKFEPSGRGYYAGLAALVTGGQLDSAILIRTADIDAAGRMRIGVGATLVRDSDPATEAAETRAKAAGLLGALDQTERRPRPANLGAHPRVRRALSTRNEPLADFWLTPGTTPAHAGRRMLIIDAEDTFTAMGARLMRALGFAVTVSRFDSPYELSGHDIVVVGPGPGDPRDFRSPKIAHVREVTRMLLELRMPFLSVCLSHQVLSSLLGLPVIRMATPNQGVARQIDLFGKSEWVYFYNTFTAIAHDRTLSSPLCDGPVDIAADPTTGEVHSLRGNGFASVQFHAASVMTRNGLAIVDQLIRGILHPARPRTGIPA